MPKYIHNLVCNMVYLKCFIPPTESADFLNGILMSISKKEISTAVYNLMHAKVCAKLSFLLDFLIAILAVQNRRAFEFMALLDMLKSTLWHLKFIQEL